MRIEASQFCRVRNCSHVLSAISTVIRPAPAPYCVVNMFEVTRTVIMYVTSPAAYMEYNESHIRMHIRVIENLSYA